MLYINRDSIPNVVYIVDHSTNGTFVNGNRLQRNEPYELKHVRIDLVYNL